MPRFPAEFQLSSLNGTNGFQISGEAANDLSGKAVSSAGDVNADGFADVLIGARWAGGRSGASYVVFGKASGFEADLALSSLNGLNGFQISGEAGEDYSGISVSSAGDVNRDGFDDLLIGAMGADPGGLSSGASYVVFGKASGFVANLALSSLDGSNGFQISGEAAGDRAGGSVSSAGDVNGDGFADFLIGAPLADPNGTYSGASYVVFGKASGFPVDLALSSLDGSNGFQISGEASGDRCGSSVSSAGDVNGDGFADLLIGAEYADATGVSSGASYVVFGKASGFQADLALSSLDGSNGFQISGEAASNKSGGSVSSAGDVNGDGFADLLIGANGAGPNGFRSGASYVVFGKASGFAAELVVSSLDGSNGFQINGEAAFDFSGDDVSGAGDVNGDGIDDLLIGAGNADPHGSYSGASYVLFGRGPFGAEDDKFSIAENGSVSGNVFADNGGGADTDPLGGALEVAAVNDLAANVGLEFALASGALVKVLADGTLTYNPNHIFDHLPAPGSGAVNLTSADNFTYTLVGGTSATVTVTISGADSDDVLLGSAGTDALNGGIGNDQLSGLAGNDGLDGGAGNDVLNGGGGIDTAVYSGAAGAVTVNLAAAGAQAIGGGFGSDTLVEIENLIGGNFADILTGNSAINVLSRGLGNDTLDGSAGNDILDGGAGSDTADYSGAIGAVKVSLAVSGPQAVGGGLGSDTLLAVENLTGGAFADTLTGNSASNALSGGLGSDILSGGAGDDTLDGGDGNDAASYASASAGVRVDLSLLTPQDTFGAGIDSLIGIEDVTGSAFADRLTGDSNANVLAGGARNDVYSDVGLRDLVIELPNQGNDTVNTALLSYRLPIHVERVNFAGIGNFVGTGNAGDNRFQTGTGNDRFVDTLGGADIFSGGVGRDTVDFRGSSSGVILDFLTGVHGGAATGDRYASIEKFLGSATQDDVMTAGAKGRVIFAGYGGDDALNGGIKNDQLLGGAGDDTLSGGAGRDTLDGGTGDDTMTGGSQGDVFVFLDAAFGQDTIADYQDGLDRFKVFSAVADDVSDFTISGNGTTSVILTLIAGNTNSITIQGAALITITAADFVFY
jgi:Ca2+-binding RTX toxin-like protein